MFDIGFSELVFVGIVALVVIGPDKLPAVARTAGVILGRMQRLTSNIKADIDKELQIEDLKQLKNELKNHELGLKEELRQGMQPVEEVIQQNKSSLKSTAQEENTLAQSDTTLNKTSHIELETTNQTEDLKRLEDELRDHELGLNEALRQGMQPVEEVIRQNKSSLKSTTQEENTLAQSRTMLNKTHHIESETTKQAEDLKRLEDELRDHELGLNEALRQGMQPVEEVIQQNKSSLKSSE